MIVGDLELYFSAAGGNLRLDFSIRMPSTNHEWSVILLLLYPPRKLGNYWYRPKQKGHCECHGYARNVSTRLYLTDCTCPTSRLDQYEIIYKTNRPQIQGVRVQAKPGLGLKAAARGVSSTSNE